MSMLGVPYSPMVPSLTRWQSGTNSRIAYSRFSVPATLLTWVKTACLRSIIEYGAERCSAKWTIASGSKEVDHRGQELVIGDVADERLDGVAGELLPDRQGALPAGESESGFALPVHGPIAGAQSCRRSRRNVPCGTGRARLPNHSNRRLPVRRFSYVLLLGIMAEIRPVRRNLLIAIRLPDTPPKLQETPTKRHICA